jgi:hypothetical protein
VILAHAILQLINGFERLGKNFLTDLNGERSSVDESGDVESLSIGSARIMGGASAGPTLENLRPPFEPALFLAHHT